MTDKEQNHIKVDLDFLDNNSNGQKSDVVSNHKKSQTSKYNWKNILIISGVILFFVWIIFSEDSSTPNNNTSTQSYTTSGQSSDDSVVIGEYTCSRYHYDKAVALNPDESESQITSAQNSLEYRANEIDRLQNEIENSYVNEYSSQYAIDQYNEMVNEYNSKLTSYNRDAANLDSRIDRYNEQIAKHNNYLTSNCTPNR